MAVFAGLVLAGSLSRVLLTDFPNFAPVAAIALFAGYYFRSRAVALLVPLAVMGISGLFIGSYDWQMMALVYGALMLPVFGRSMLRRWFSLDEGAAPLRASAGLLASSLGASISFFSITNFRRVVVVRHLRTQCCRNDPLLCASDPILPLHTDHWPAISSLPSCFSAATH